MTEKEVGLRLSVRKNKQQSVSKKHNDDKSTDTSFSNELQAPYTVTFSKHRKKMEEWYCHMDSVSLLDRGATNKKILQLRHSESGQYLCSDEEGNVGVCDEPTASTYWYMDPAVSSSTPVPMTPSPPRLSRNVSSDSDDSFANFSMDSEGPGFEFSELSVTLISKEHNRRLCYTSEDTGFERSSSSLHLVTRSSDENNNPDHSSHPAIWELQYTSGELCFMSNPVIHCQLRCNMVGQLSLSDKFDGWQVFRFIELGNGDVAISSWTHYSKFLSSDMDGQVYMVDSSKRGYAERWRLEPSQGRNGVCIKSIAYNRYLSVGRIQNEALCTTTKPNDYATWHLDAAHSHIYYLTTLSNSLVNTAPSMDMLATEDSAHEHDALTGNNINSLNKTLDSLNQSLRKSYSRMYSSHTQVDKHISTSRKGPFLTTNRRKWEEWKLEVRDGCVTFFNVFQEKYLGCNSSGKVHTTTSKGPWSYWEMEESPNGGILLRSKEHNRYLAVDVYGDGSLCTTSEEEPTGLEHSWRLDPRLPHTLSASKVAVLSAVAVLGVAATVAMPFAVLGAVEAAGVAVTELAVAGLSAEALGAAGAGAVVGVSSLGATAVLLPDTPGQKSHPMSLSLSCSEDAMSTHQRPISSWRSWVAPETTVITPQSSPLTTCNNSVLIKYNV
jgi:hypothetical protein